MRLKIGSKVYPSFALDSVSLKDIIVFSGEVRDLRADLDWSWSDVLNCSQDYDGLTEADLIKRPEWPLFLGSIVWATRRVNGEQVSFSEAVDFDPMTVDFIDEPEDHKPGKPKGARKPRKASAPAAVKAAPDESTTSVPEGSGSPSTPG